MAEEAPKGLGPSRPDAMGPKSLWQAPSGPRRAVQRARSEATHAAPAQPEPAAMEPAPPPPPGRRLTVRFSAGQDYGGTITELLDGHRATERATRAPTDPVGRREWSKES